MHESEMQKDAKNAQIVQDEWDVDTVKQTPNIKPDACSPIKQHVFNNSTVLFPYVPSTATPTT